jgi:hypothetical protein
MVQRLGSLLEGNARRSFVGRADELDRLLRLFEPGQPPVWFVEGISGIGKSRLIAQFAAAIDDASVRVLRLDCRTIEPTADAFLAALAAEAGVRPSGPEQVIDAIAASHERIVLTLDAYESFLMLDGWMRKSFLPLLTEDMRVVIASKIPPGSGWLTAPEWAGLFRRMPIGLLPEADALAMMTARGMSHEIAERVNRVARGHPLALQMTAEASGDLSTIRLEQDTIPGLIGHLARTYLAEAPDDHSRRLVEAAAVVRRVTRPLLNAMLPDEPDAQAFDALSRLPFVEHRSDGLVLHELVQGAIANWLRTADPERYARYRRAAWRHLRSREASTADLWRTTADLLFLLENPHIREGFFPSGGSTCQVDPAQPSDWPAILGIHRAQEGAEARALLQMYWEGLPEAFGTVRDHAGEIVGYTLALTSDAVDAAMLIADPVLRAWIHHLERYPIPPRQRAIFARSWLVRDSGEAPSPAQAAIWLETKRLYMEMRPKLRRIYVCQRDFSAYRTAFRHLGFVDLPEGTVRLDGVTFNSLMLDFGPGSVDGWLAGLIASELGLHTAGLLDESARELVVHGERVGLTRLEFEVMRYLAHRPGQAVSRMDLLVDVWGTDYDGGSNVVDAIVTSLRRKLGSHAGALETVRGIGYRLRPA